MSVEKRAIRKQMRTARKAMPAVAVDAAGIAVMEQLRTFPRYLAARSVIAYVASDNEVPTAQLIEDVMLSGRPLYLPRTTGVSKVVRWFPGDPLMRGVGGVLEPACESPLPPVGGVFVLVPVVAWDEFGGRVGRGGGFYDQLLANIAPDSLAVGLAYEFQRLPRVPRDSWDTCLHYVITERRVVACGNPHPPTARTVLGGGCVH